MEIISDPNFTITEVPLTFDTLKHGDVFRLANVSYHEAISNHQIYMRTQLSQNQENVVQLHNGQQCSIAPDVEVIPHVASVVVIPND